MPKISRVYFLFFGLLDLTALLVAFFYSLDALGEYFSYFTVLSNILITFAFLSFGIRGEKKALRSNMIRISYGPAVLYMSITGIVFWTILHGGAGHFQAIPWVNMVLHGITPIAAFTGWILFPLRLKDSYRNVYTWLIPPLLFVFYTLVRGPIAHWYPYVFLNPETAGGYVGVMKYVIGILAGSYIVGVLLIFANHKLRKI